MTFVTSLALAIGLLAVLPVLVHLLRRGRTAALPFAPARLVPAHPHLATRRQSLDERRLLAVRVVLVIGLALLGAVPLLRCKHNVLGRKDGASIARVFILDDSGSMQTEVSSGRSRFERAREVAKSLVEQMRDGDRIGIVLASKPARVLLAPSPSEEALSRALASLRCTSRPTDLAEALALSSSLLAREPQVDKRALVFSDLADEGWSAPADAELVLRELAVPKDDCGLLRARTGKSLLSVESVCTTPAPSTPRRLQLYVGSKAPRVLLELPFSPSSHREAVLPLGSVRTDAQEELWVRLTPADSNPANDTTPVITNQQVLRVGIYSDPATGQLATGGPPILEQALRAVDPELELVVLPTIPDDSRVLRSVSMLLLDDPPLFSAESRQSLSEFVRRGGTAIALFGPAASRAQLGSLPAPFLEQPASWQTESVPSGLDRSSLVSERLDPAPFERLQAKGRLVFDESHDPKAIVRARWSDQRPFWLERPLGRGSLHVFGLPSNVALSDFALRPTYLSLLTELLAQHRAHGQDRVVTVGDAWRFYGGERPLVHDSDGVVLSPVPLAAAGESVVRPDRVGRYRVELGSGSEHRIALWPESETLTAPRAWPRRPDATASQSTGLLDGSQYVSLALLALLMVELLLRATPLTRGLRAWIGAGLPGPRTRR